MTDIYAPRRDPAPDWLDPALLFAPGEEPETGFFHAVELAHSERSIAAMKVTA